jgi:hypothetical protein
MPAITDTITHFTIALTVREHSRSHSRSSCSLPRPPRVFPTPLANPTTPTYQKVQPICGTLLWPMSKVDRTLFVGCPKSAWHTPPLSAPAFLLPSHQADYCSLGPSTERTAPSSYGHWDGDWLNPAAMFLANAYRMAFEPKWNKSSINHQ